MTTEKDMTTGVNYLVLMDGTQGPQFNQHSAHIHWGLWGTNILLGHDYYSSPDFLLHLHKIITICLDMVQVTLSFYSLSSYTLNFKINQRTPL